MRNILSDDIIARSLDDGYGDVKYDDGENPKHVPSFVTPFKPKPENLFGAQDSKLNYLAAEINGERYTIGDYAAKLDPDIKWIGGENKHDNQLFPIIFKTILAKMNTKDFQVVDMLGLNLPIKYDTPERRNLLRKIAQDNHTVKLSDDGVNFYRRDVYVEDVLIRKQGEGSLYDVILDKNGTLIDEKTAGGFNVVVDIGARTLNILTVDALDVQPSLTSTTNDGMFKAYDQVAEYLERKLDIVIPNGKLPQVISEKSIKGIDISQFIHKANEQHANNIVSILETKFVNSFSFIETMIFTGGGSEVMRNYLNKAFNNRGIEVIFRDRYSNARGLRRFAYRKAKENKSKGIIARVGGQHGYGQ